MVSDTAASAAPSAPWPSRPAVLAATGLGKRYRRRWALSECTVTVPAGHVVGLVGPNGAGKTTLLQLAAGLLIPSAGAISVFGQRPAAGPEQLGRLGFVAQDAPVYRSLTVAAHLQMGAALNPGWDSELARQRIAALGLDPRMRAGRLSGGQRAQLALTLAIAKRPDLLILDERVAGLDPLARTQFLAALRELSAERQTTIVLSSHLVADLERICDYLVLLVASRVRLAGRIDELLAAHHWLSGPEHEPASLGRLMPGTEVIASTHSTSGLAVLVRSGDMTLPPGWHRDPARLDDLVVAYLSQAASAQVTAAGSPR